MEDLKRDLREHMDNDREDFRAINDKLDASNAKLDQIIGQWRVVGAVVGVLVGLLGTVLGSWI